MSMFARAREAARLTPDSRNRAADFYRTAAICFVVLGHWMLVAAYAPGGALELRNILADDPWTQLLTLLFQVMPTFFFVGGYSNAASWSSARRSEDKRAAWLAGRLRRLLLPLVPLVLVWAAAAVVAYWLGTDPVLVRDASQAALIPVWFLAVYVLVTTVVPWTYALWERAGLWSVAGFAGLAILIDLVGVGLGQGWLRWANYGAVWLAVHQLGYWWWRGKPSAGQAASLVALGLVWLWVLLGPANYPVSMISVPGEDFSNTRPPTTAMLALGAVQIGLLLLLEGPVSRWLRRETPWALVIVVTQRIMSVYLWHLTTLIVLIGLSVAAGGIGLGLEPGTGGWWALRPLWVVVLCLGLLPFLALFGRFESGSRGGGAAGPVRSALAALVTCAGLTMLALTGIGWAGAPGFNWIAVALVVGGVALATVSPRTS